MRSSRWKERARCIAGRDPAVVYAFASTASDPHSRQLHTRAFAAALDSAACHLHVRDISDRSADIVTYGCTLTSANLLSAAITTQRSQHQT